MLVFSFVVIGKNEGKKLDRCFISIETFVKELNILHEIIYIDSQSTDNTYDVLATWKTVRFYILGGICNAARARNLGAQKAKGNILVFIDGDMELVPSFGAKMIVGGQLVHPFMNGYRIDYFYDRDWRFISDNSEQINRSLKSQYMVTTGGLFIITKKLWQKVGGMDNRLRAFEDNDLAYRVFLKTKTKILKIGGILAKHHTINYTNKKRFRALVSGNYFMYRGVLYRKHLFNFSILYRLLKRDLSFTCMLLAIMSSIVFGNGMLLALYFVASVFRLFFIKMDKDSAGYAQRLWLNMIIDVKILAGLLFFYPTNIMPVVKTQKDVEH